MVEAVAYTKDGNLLKLYAKDFNEVFEKLAAYEIVEFTGKQIKLTDIRQGKEKTNCDRSR